MNINSSSDTLMNVWRINYRSEFESLKILSECKKKGVVQACIFTIERNRELFSLRLHFFFFFEI